MLSVEIADLQGADFDLALLGFDDAELNKLLTDDEDVQDDDFDVDSELQNPPSPKQATCGYWVSTVWSAAIAPKRTPSICLWKANMPISW